MTVIVHGGDAIYGGLSFDGPATSTDNAIARWDGTSGELLQNSGILITDSAGFTTTAAMAWAHSGGAFSITSTSQNLSLVTATSGTLALTSAGALNITAVASSTFAFSGGPFALQTSNQALTLQTVSSGALNIISAGTLALSSTTGDWQASGALTLDSSGGAISIGGDAVAQAINVGTGAAARTITIGNVTGATGIVLNYGTGYISTPEALVMGSTVSRSHDSPGGSSVILGNGARANGLASIGIGLDCDAAGTASVCLGRATTVSGTPGIAIGYGANAGANQIRFGGTDVFTDFAFASGANAQFSHWKTATGGPVSVTGSSATTTVASAIPAGALVTHVSIRVTTAIVCSGDDTFDVGVSGATTRYGTAVAGTVDTTNKGPAVSGSGGYAAATDLVLTASGGGTFTSGAFRWTVHYFDVTPPTS